MQLIFQFSDPLSNGVDFPVPRMQVAGIGLAQHIQRAFGIIQLPLVDVYGGQVEKRMQVFWICLMRSPEQLGCLLQPILVRQGYSEQVIVI